MMRIGLKVLLTASLLLFITGCGATTSTMEQERNAFNNIEQKISTLWNTSQDDLAQNITEKDFEHVMQAFETLEQQELDEKETERLQEVKDSIEELQALFSFDQQVKKAAKNEESLTKKKITQLQKQVIDYKEVKGFFNRQEKAIEGLEVQFASKEITSKIAGLYNDQEQIRLDITKDELTAIRTLISTLPDEKAQEDFEQQVTKAESDLRTRYAQVTKEQAEQPTESAQETNTPTTGQQEQQQQATEKTTEVPQNKQTPTTENKQETQQQTTEAVEKKQETTPKQPAQPQTTQEPAAQTKYVGNGIVIASKKYPLPASHAPGESSTARAAFNKMAAAAKNEGIELTAFSTYRSYDYQVDLYNRYVARDGQAAADRYSAKPGYSEHQTGLAFDIGEVGQENHFASSSFAQTKGGKWLASNAQNYGFILRYPPGKESVTGYMYEAWHYRYVGVDLAKQIHARNTTLEEYFGI